MLQRVALKKEENFTANSRSQSQVTFATQEISSTPALAKRQPEKKHRVDRAGNLLVQSKRQSDKSSKLNYASFAKDEARMVSNMVKVTGPDQERIKAAVFIAERLENIVNFTRDKEAKHDTYQSPTIRS